MAEKKSIVIVGGGFGGVRAAINLAKNAKDCRIILINDLPTHCFHPDLYEVATAVLQKGTKIAFERLQSTVNIPLKEIFAKKNIEIVIDRVESIDCPNSLVLTTSDRFNYDYLVLGLGSRTSYHGIAGAESYSHPLKNTSDALNIRNDLVELASVKDKVEVVIAGGGTTGVELAGELSYFLPGIQITLIEGSDQILPGLPKWMRQKALTRLKSLNIKVLLTQTISKVEQDQIICDNGQITKFDYLIWTAGVSAENLNGQIKGVDFTKKGRIQVVKDLAVKNYPNVFVVGDLAEYLDREGVSLPQTAQVAIAMGEKTASNIAAEIKGKALTEFDYSHQGYVVSIGGKYALSNVFDLKLEGLLAWFLKRVISLNYLLSILPIMKAVNLWWKGVKVYTQNDQR